MFNCFAIIQKEGLSPNAVTLVCILKSCGSIEGIVVSEYVCQMWRVCKISELPIQDIVSWNALIGEYAK